MLELDQGFVNDSNGIISFEGIRKFQSQRILVSDWPQSVHQGRNQTIIFIIHYSAHHFLFA